MNNLNRTQFQSLRRRHNSVDFDIFDASRGRHGKMVAVFASRDDAQGYADDAKFLGVAGVVIADLPKGIFKVTHRG